ncbi:MAG: GNAT family N-acetyltransferase [Polyangiaceae bacterium]|nr:GNAT family N-acetyltransferase [Polyangiaceae bacterium]
MTFAIRPARPEDLPRLGVLAGGLVRLHHATDPRRFLLVDGVEEGYARWFSQELGRDGAIVLVAEAELAEGPQIVGYAYATLEGRDWNMLLDEHGAIHDVMVDPTARRSGVGLGLMRALVPALEARGATRVVLSTMVQNEAAQRLFAACGFRPTMIEMTRG